MIRVLICLVMLGAVEGGALGEKFEHPKFKFSLEVPSGFEALRDPQPNVGVLVKNKTGGYPTFNVVAEGGAFTPDPKRKDAQAADVQREYALVGFTDARVLDSDLTEINGLPALRTQLTYSYQGRSLGAFVWKIAGQTEHLILTFISEAGDLGADKTRNNLISSFQIERPPERSTDSGPSDDNEIPYVRILMTSFALILASMGLWYLAGKRSRSS